MEAAMSNSDYIELVEDINSNADKYLVSPVITGYHASLFRDKINEESPDDPNIANNVFSNAIQSLSYFINPNYVSDSKTLSKILALGRVQSGKTSFFLATVSLAFDNGYDLVIVIGGTKKPLVEQNYVRAVEEFSNNYKVKIYLVNSVTCAQISNDIDNGYKVVLITLKNAADLKNLGKVRSFVEELSNIPVLVVDDEGDEYTPGMEALAKRTGRDGINHDLISEIIGTPRICTFLSVTATPQANFLISTINSISPDFCVLVRPGPGYTGGNSFHDTETNPHVVSIYDADDFSESTPDSFKDALYFFVFSICLKRSRGDNRQLSMLIHPSSLKAIHDDVADKISSMIETIKGPLLEPHNISHAEHVQRVVEQINNYREMNPELADEINEPSIIEQIPFAIQNMETFVFNTGDIGKDDIQREKESECPYKIYVGGNMLGRGLTIKNLNVSYIFRDSKVTAIDTLYQRARWLGYKGSYFDVCRVYMTQSLKEKFVAVVDNENDMWNKLESYLLTNYSIKAFPRTFILSDTSGKLVLTRPSISKTVTLEITSSGYQYDLSLNFAAGAKEDNRDIYFNYLNSHKNELFEKQFGTNPLQTHLILRTTFTEFYENFLAKYHFPRKSKKLGSMTMEKIYHQVLDGVYENKLFVIVMRYKHKEYRTAQEIVGEKWLLELPQSYNNNKTYYEGDKSLEIYKDLMHFQIHLVYTDENNKEDFYPILAFNNPLSEKTIRFVTGDNIYGEV